MCYLHAPAGEQMLRCERACNHKPQKLQLRLHHNLARRAVFTAARGGVIYRARARASLYQNPTVSLVRFFLLFLRLPQIALLSGFCQRFWRRHNRPGKYRQEGRTRDPLHSREAMLAPLHPRLTPDPPSVMSCTPATLSTATTRVMPPARHSLVTLHRAAATHSLEPASVREQVPARARGAISPRPRLCVLSIYRSAGT